MALLIRAARGAGEIALRHWRLSPRAWDKPDGTGPVTEADLNVNVYLETLLRAARPYVKRDAPGGKPVGFKSATGEGKRPFGAKPKPAAARPSAADTSKRFVPPKRPKA